MEQDQIPSNSMSFLQHSIFVTAKTAQIAAWVALASGLVAIANLLNFPVQQILIPENKEAGISEAQIQQMTKAVLSMAAIIGLAISLVTFFFLARFSSKTKKGITNNQPVAITEGLQSLGRYFKTWGILMMMAMVVFALSALGMLLRG